jgi:hypothetical protein
VLTFNAYAHDNGIVEAEGLSEERDIHIGWFKPNRV